MLHGAMQWLSISPEQERRQRLSQSEIVRSGLQDLQLSNPRLTSAERVVEAATRFQFSLPLWSRNAYLEMGEGIKQEVGNGVGCTNTTATKSTSEEGDGSDGYFESPTNGKNACSK